jgi:hypothetical protein
MELEAAKRKTKILDNFQAGSLMFLDLQVVFPGTSTEYKD